MTDYTELIRSLRCENTGDDECGSSDCTYWSGLGCMDGQLMEDAADAIEALQAQLPKRGEWIVKGANRIDCSVCGHSVCFAFGLIDGSFDLYKYCPECGAKMEVQDG